MPHTAAAYLRDTSLLMRNGYTNDCVVHACRIAELLRADGRAPWIGRVREINILEDGRRFHVPLIPKRFAGHHALTWNTHYVACAAGDVYDPIVGEPISVDDYAAAVFGHPYAVATHFDAAATEDLLRDGTLAAAFRPTRS